jgi:hypothetical protein
MPLNLSISPHGQLLTYDSHGAADGDLQPAVSGRVATAFGRGAAHGLLNLATTEHQSALTPPFAFAREFARTYLTRLCQTPEHDRGAALSPVRPPDEVDLAALVLRAPPMQGLEYLTPDVLASWWTDLDTLVREEIRRHTGGAQAWLTEQNPVWRLVGRVTFHLAENKRDPEHPFAFLATFARRLSAQGRVQHEPLGRALQQYAGAKNRPALLALLVPIQRAAERSELARELVESGDVYHPLAWTPRDAHRFLQDVPVFEESGLIVRVPDWWKAGRPPRPVVTVKVDGRRGSPIGLDALLDLDVGVALDGEPLTEAEIQQVVASVGGLVPLKGKWVEVDREKLAEALRHWKTVEREARSGGLSFFEGMRLLSGVPLEPASAGETIAESQAWVGLAAGPELERTLQRLRSPESPPDAAPAGLRAELRPYQRTGVGWLRFVTGLGLGACLADDMGLGKTVQVIAVLLRLKREKAATLPSLLVVPASLIANWQSEIARFAPALSVLIAHPSEWPAGQAGLSAADADARDAVITSYGMLTRLPWLRERPWNLVVLDEAQAIKNSGTRQARAVKELRAAARVALTGTPVENRLSDLWSIFDFLNPGLLGGAKAFARLVKSMEARPNASYAPLRALVQPYILRRLKTDKRVIADLPDKTEVRAYCGLSRQQAALYEAAVRDLESRLQGTSGIGRRGLVLAQLMRLKQICNHPAQLLGTGTYDAAHSGKFQRLGALCEEVAARQEKVLVFTQFRELAEPLVDYLEGVFGRRGQVLHGGTTVARRRDLVARFQRDDGPPFFVLSLRAGGTGLNLTAASHVIHFDRWWNPAVENQATDRAFRIGQTKNVLVHKFVCRGTVEERIDAMIAQKSDLVGDLLEGGEMLLTEMPDDELLKFVALDVTKAIES